MTYEYRPAKRSEAKPLIGMYAESGGGKTYSALLLARGFVGPKGRICMIETESGRGEAFSDPREYPEIGGYDVISLRSDFSPKAYGEAISVAEKAGVDALIIDSASHEWEADGGVLSMAAANQAANMKGVLVWQAPKIEHKRYFMLRFMTTPVKLVILCMRAKYPMQEVPKANGHGKEWVRAKELQPIQADDILYEMFVHGWLSRGDHAFHLTKCTAKALTGVFADGKPITLNTGKQLAQWARGETSGSAHPREPTLIQADAPAAPADAASAAGSTEGGDRHDPASDGTAAHVHGRSVTATAKGGDAPTAPIFDAFGPVQIPLTAEGAIRFVDELEKLCREHGHDSWAENRESARKFAPLDAGAKERLNLLRVNYGSKTKRTAA